MARMSVALIDVNKSWSAMKTKIDFPTTALLVVALLVTTGLGAIVQTNATSKLDQQQDSYSSQDSTTPQQDHLLGQPSSPREAQSPDSQPSAGTKCGYRSCPALEANKINVHIVAHTHDDVGWLKTVDQYYYGTKKSYSPFGVQYILDSLMPQLVMDKSKRFVYVEMSFFSKWWQEQDEHMRGIVRRLVDEGRLEFINGGWCMNDEATVSYQSTIEQMTLGLRFLNETFGQCAIPRVGWQIDPFGHTNEQASLFAQFGFDGMYFTREGHEDKAARIRNKSLDLIWHGDRALDGQSGTIFTSVMRDFYNAPPGFCFDVMCQDDDLVDNKKSFEYNIDTKGKKFIDYLRSYAASRLTNHILIPIGGDFHFTAAGQNFKNIDKLIRFVRATAPDLHVFYSTPSCYQQAVHKQLTASDDEIRLPEKYDDFMPYDSTPTVWWSGFYSSRPSVKLIERELANLLPVTRMISLANLLKLQNNRRWPEEVKEHESRCLMPLWEIYSDLQHHDAVTGTQKEHVNADYIRRAYVATQACAKFIGTFRRSKINEYTRKSPKYQHLRDSGKRFNLDPLYLEDTTFCPLLNISQCDAIESDVDSRRYTNNSQHPNNRRVKRASRSDLPPELDTKAILLNVYNPLAKAISQHDIRLPCNGRCDLDKMRVIHLSTNDTMRLIRLPLPSGVATLPFRDAVTNYEVLFYANLPALGYTSFVIEDDNNEEIVDEEYEPGDSLVINDDAPDPSRLSRSRRIRRDLRSEQPARRRYEYFTINLMGPSSDRSSAGGPTRPRRDPNGNSLSQQSAADRVIIKFDMATGLIIGLKRASDGSVLNITQKFGYYFPATSQAQPGAYIFRPNSSEPVLMEKPVVYKMFKRKNGALIEIHQKWADWLWQTIRVDQKKNYIEFDYVAGPVPIEQQRLGREVVTRYITNMASNGVFLTDSNGRQLMARHRKRSEFAENLGGSFYPVVSTIMLKNTAHSNTSNNGKSPAEAVAILVDRPQGGTSLKEGELELLIHRRMTMDDDWGVGEPLNEPGEDGRGLVSRGRHRLYIKFQEQDSTAGGGGNNRDRNQKHPRPQLFKLARSQRENLTHEILFYENKMDTRLDNKVPKQVARNTDTYIVHDPLYSDLKQEARRYALKPILTFDRLRVSASELVEMIAADNNVKIKTDLTLLNISLPTNVHLLTLQPWTSRPNEILIRLENLDNPLTIHPFPDYESYQNLVRFYKSSSDYRDLSTQNNPTSENECDDKLRPRVEVDIEYLIKRIRIVSLEELTLGANAKLADLRRLDWTGERINAANCDSTTKMTSIKLAPRQIRTFLARFEFLSLI